MNLFQLAHLECLERELAETVSVKRETQKTKDFLRYEMRRKTFYLLNTPDGEAERIIMYYEQRVSGIKQKCSSERRFLLGES